MIPDPFVDLLARMQKHLAAFECRLVPRGDKRYDVVDLYDGHVIGHEIDDLEAFAEANGVFLVR